MPRFDPKLPASWIAGQTPAKRSKPPGPKVVTPGLDPGIDSRHCGAVPHWVYILANSKRGTLHVGVTGDLVRRVFQHRRGRPAASPPATPSRATSGTRIHWSRDWKVTLIERGNPDWRDLYHDIPA